MLERNWIYLIKNKIPSFAARFAQTSEIRTLVDNLCLDYYECTWTRLTAGRVQRSVLILTLVVST